MELCHGDLHSFLSRRYDQGNPEPLSEMDIWSIFKQVISGIKFIHSQGIIHGDLKPKNGTSSHDITHFSPLYS
jgi:serine/threonine protein kinase